MGTKWGLDRDREYHQAKAAIVTGLEREARILDLSLAEATLFMAGILLRAQHHTTH